MKIDQNMTFPYPVLGIRDDILPAPDCDIETYEDENNYFFKLKCDLHNPSIKFYIDVKKQAVYCCEVDCPHTFYRKCYRSTKPEFEIAVPRKSVCNDCQVTVTVVTTTKIDRYYNSNANHDYDGYEFDLEQGDILALVGSFIVPTDIREDEIKTVGSFMHFTKGAKDSEISFYLGGSDIEINLPEEMFNIYTMKLKNDQYKPLIISSVINEALVYAILNYSDYTGQRWARILDSAVKNNEDLSGIELADIKDDPREAFDIARVLLKNPHRILFDKVDDILTDNID